MVIDAGNVFMAGVGVDGAKVVGVKVRASGLRYLKWNRLKRNRQVRPHGSKGFIGIGKNI